MVAFLLRRTLSLIPVLLSVTVVVFLALHLAPGDPARLLLGPLATPASLATLRKQLGLDEPLPVQYLLWFRDVLQGNFGTSTAYHQPVLPLLAPRLLNTLLLASVAFILATVVGVTAGMISAIFANRWQDDAVNLLAFLGLAAPVFWVGLLLALTFGVTLRWLPVAGMTTGGSQTSVGDVGVHLILPAVTLAIAPAAVIAQITRVSVVRELSQLYVLVGRAKGLSHARAVFVHGLRNGLIPIVTTLGLVLNYVIGGDVIVENIFSWPGIGQLLVQSILNRDYPVVLASTILLAVIFVMVNFLVDLIYPLVDPRVRVHG
jgi:peptide/nickel transport system permease protein